MHRLNWFASANELFVTNTVSAIFNFFSTPPLSVILSMQTFLLKRERGYIFETEAIKQSPTPFIEGGILEHLLILSQFRRKTRENELNIFILIYSLILSRKKPFMILT